KNKNLPFQFAGSLISKPAEPFGAPKPVVFRLPMTSQNSGFEPAAGTSVADVIVILGIWRPESAATSHLDNAAAAGGAVIAPTATNAAVVASNFAVKDIDIPPYS